MRLSKFIYFIKDKTIKHIITTNSALPTDYIFNSSPKLQAKIKVFRKRRATWWRITPIIEWVDILTPKNDIKIKIFNNVQIK